MSKKFDPKHASANGYTKADWDAVQSAELSEADLQAAVPFAEALPDLAERFTKEIANRGRPRSEAPKVAVSIRLDPDVLERLKEDGKGWQTRANAMLRKAVGL